MLVYSMLGARQTPAVAFKLASPTAAAAAAAVPPSSGVPAAGRHGVSL